jgi:phosphatidylglycerophosphate synthase
MPAPSAVWWATDSVLYDALYKPLSAHLCWLDPNIVTIACFALVFPLIYGLHYRWSLGALVALAFVRQSLDCMDGAIARRCKTTSKTGALLDVMEDTATVALLGGFMVWSLWKKPFVAIPMLVFILYTLTVYVRQVGDHLADRPVVYSAFEQFVHDNTVVLSMIIIVAFRFVLGKVV